MTQDTILVSPTLPACLKFGSSCWSAFQTRQSGDTQLHAGAGCAQPRLSSRNLRVRPDHFPPRNLKLETRNVSRAQFIRVNSWSPSQPLDLTLFNVIYRKNSLPNPLKARVRTPSHVNQKFFLITAAT